MNNNTKCIDFNYHKPSLAQQVPDLMKAGRPEAFVGSRMRDSK